MLISADFYKKADFPSKFHIVPIFQNSVDIGKQEFFQPDNFS